MNYSSTDIFQGLRYALLSLEDADLQGKAKKQKDLAILLEGLKQTYENAVQDLHHDNKFSDQTSQLAENLKATENFFQSSKSLAQNQTMLPLLQDHAATLSQALSIYQQGQETMASAAQDVSSQPLQALLPQMQQTTDALSDHINQLGSKLAAMINAAPNSGNSPTSGGDQTFYDMSNMDVFSAILLMTTSSYKMASALGALQARISTSLNSLLGLLNNLQAIMSKLNQFYQDAMVQISKISNKQCPGTINWGGSYCGVAWSDLIKSMSSSQVTGGGIVFTPAEVAGNPMIGMFGTQGPNGTYTISQNDGGVDQFSQAIKYISEQLSGLMPNDNNGGQNPYGSFYANNGDSAQSSQNTTSFLQAVGKQTEMLQNRLSAVANSVNLCQQGNAQILNIFQQILSLQSSLMSKL